MLTRIVLLARISPSHHSATTPHSLVGVLSSCPFCYQPCPPPVPASPVLSTDFVDALMTYGILLLFGTASRASLFAFISHTYANMAAWLLKLPPAILPYADVRQLQTHVSPATHLFLCRAYNVRSLCGRYLWCAQHSRLPRFTLHAHRAKVHACDLPSPLHVWRHAPALPSLGRATGALYYNDKISLRLR